MKETQDKESTLFQLLSIFLILGGGFWFLIWGTGYSIEYITRPSIGDMMRCQGTDGKVVAYTENNILIIYDTKRQRSRRNQCSKISIPPKRIEKDEGYYSTQKSWMDILSD